MSGLRRIRGNGLALVLACSCSAAASAQAQSEDTSALADQLMQLLTQSGIQLPNGTQGSMAGEQQGQGAAPPNPMGVANPDSWQLTPEQRGYRPPSATESSANGPTAVPAGGAGGRAAKSSTPLPPQTIYRWRDRKGRPFYTNSVEAIPESERARAKVDLSHITLNTELGNELNRRLEQRYEKLASTPKCEELREAAQLGFLERMWADYTPLVLCGGMLLLFVLFTPSALHRFGGPAWSRTLMMAIPTLALSGVVMFSMRETNLAVIEMKHKAEPCDQHTFDGMRSSPDAVLRRAALVRQLQSIVLPSIPTAHP